MTNSSSFWRKVIYISIIGLLLLPLSMLGQPATKKADADVPDGGGVLANIRQEQGLAQSSLGDIDPASETMKLATLGLKGVAVTILWENANTYKDEENWEAFSATVNQIIKLQPNFITVWEFQAHNIAYNVSVEFDDYQARYDWVKKGLDFLIQGLAYNRRDFKILRSLGFFYGTKIGRSDERLQFRNMFRQDKDYHQFLADYVTMDDKVSTPYGVDNWLVARQWYLKAEDKVRQNIAGQPTSQLMFYKDSPGQLRNCAMDLEEEFRPEQPARRKWEDAFDAWNDFGNRSLRTSWETELRLNDKTVAREKLQKLQDELDEMVPGARESILADLRTKVPADQLAAYDKPALERSLEEIYLALEARKGLVVNDELVAEKAAPEKADAAYRKLRVIQFASEELRRIENYRGQTNYLYWLKRCQAEQSQLNLEARAALYDARLLNEQAVLTTTTKVDPITLESTESPGAKEKFEESFEKWAEVFDQYPELIDSITAQELMEAVTEYRLVLERLVEPFPSPFALDFVFERTGMGQYAEELDDLEKDKQDSPTDDATESESSSEATSEAAPVDSQESDGDSEESTDGESTDESAESEGSDAASGDEGDGDSSDGDSP